MTHARAVHPLRSDVVLDLVLMATVGGKRVAMYR